jgi:predicted site-specific integrase-resolvase
MPLEKINKYPAIMNRVNSMRMYTTYFIDEEDDLKAEIEKLKGDLLLKENEVEDLKTGILIKEAEVLGLKKALKKQKEEDLVLMSELETWKSNAPVERPKENVTEENVTEENVTEENVTEENVTEEVSHVLTLLQSGLTTTQVSEKYSISRRTLSRWIKNFGIKNIGTDKNPKWVKE